MSSDSTPSASFPQEKTYSTYNAAEGKAYAQTRPDYTPKVYQTILDHHVSTGGQLDMLLDVGCGPGNVTRALAPKFEKAIGIDPGEGMIATARTLGPSSQSNIKYEISTCEELGANLIPPIANASVDLITIANAAHWFDMTRFWAAAERVLKPGGTVAIWTTGHPRIHPSAPNAAAIQAVCDAHVENDMKPHMLPGNFIAQNRYQDLILPWHVSSDQHVSAFDENTFVRLEWPSDEPWHTIGPHGTEGTDLDVWEKVLATCSVEARWRHVNPDLVGTDKDVLKIFRTKVEHLLHEAGVKPGAEKIRTVVDAVILFVKKSV